MPGTPTPAEAGGLWILADPGEAEAFVSAGIVGERTDGSLRVLTDYGERIVRQGVDAWPLAAPVVVRAGEDALRATADLCDCTELHAVSLRSNPCRRPLPPRLSLTSACVCVMP